jgi:hypothetical protein
MMPAQWLAGLQNPPRSPKGRGQTRRTLRLVCISRAAVKVYQGLREEIYKTENTDFRARLKRREDAIVSIIKKLGGA